MTTRFDLDYRPMFRESRERACSDAMPTGDQVPCMLGAER